MHVDQAFLEVNLGNIKHNYLSLSSRLKSGRCGAAVKANAYGLGVEAVAPALAQVGCRDFFVATLEEGIQVRGAKVEGRVYVINGIGKGEEKECAAHHLIPVLNTPEQWKRWAAWNEKCSPAPCPSALHIDTGMNRLGLSAKELAALGADTLKHAGIGMIMSHLACADEPGHTLNKDQLARFKGALKRFPSLPASLANSSGIFLGRNYHFDLARPGCALYGINPMPDKKNPMKPVASLTAPVLQIREIGGKESIGYDATYYAKRGDRIATVGIGYADGFFRHLSNIASGYIEKHKVPVVGRVSMDMVMVDVTRVPSALLAKNPRVEFIGLHQDIDAFAENAKTIGYEVFTRLGRRVKRLYI